MVFQVSSGDLGISVYPRLSVVAVMDHGHTTPVMEVSSLSTSVGVPQQGVGVICAGASEPFANENSNHLWW